MSTPVTVVIITKNETNNIEECLKSVHGWANEIVVVDDESTDNTAELVKKYTDKVFTRKMENEGRHRNWAYAQATNEWVLSLDADERALPELRIAITEAIADAEDKIGFNIPRRNFIGTYWVKHGGQYPSAQLRLFRKDRFQYEEDAVHPRARYEGKVGNIQADMLHYSYRDFSHFLRKLDGQTTLEAKKWFDTGRKVTLGKALWRMTDRFFRTYISKQGFKDGFMGYMVANFAGLYQIVSYAKYYEMKRDNK